MARACYALSRWRWKKRLNTGKAQHQSDLAEEAE